MVAVGFDTTESLAQLESFRQPNSYPWPVASASRQMARDFRVNVQSTSLILSSSGIVLFRQGYGAGSADAWRQALDGVVK